LTVKFIHEQLASCIVSQRLHSRYHAIEARHFNCIFLC
jgi:hypothetical protein